MCKLLSLGLTVTSNVSPDVELRVSVHLRARVRRPQLPAEGVDADPPELSSPERGWTGTNAIPKAFGEILGRVRCVGENLGRVQCDQMLRVISDPICAYMAQGYTNMLRS